MGDAITPAAAPKTLRELRRESGYTQHQLGRLAGCTFQTIGYLERGVQRDTARRILFGIARALGTSVDVVEAAIERSFLEAN